MPPPALLMRPSLFSPQHLYNAAAFRARTKLTPGRVRDKAAGVL